MSTPRPLASLICSGAAARAGRQRARRQLSLALKSTNPDQGQFMLSTSILLVGQSVIATAAAAELLMAVGDTRHFCKTRARLMRITRASNVPAAL
jgi:hypothetical protein